MNICITCCPCFLPFPALVFLPLALLFVPLLPQWAYFEPGGLCGPPVLYVLQIDSHIKIIRYKHKRSQTNLHPHSPVLLTNTHLDPHTPPYSDFSGAPWTGESSSPLLQCRSSLWLSKHYSWTLLFLSFLCVLFQLMWMTICWMACHRKVPSFFLSRELSECLGRRRRYRIRIMAES